MFINCKHCNALVATDPATELPPERCPRCRGELRAASPAPAAAPAGVEPAPVASTPPSIGPLLLEPSAVVEVRTGPAAADAGDDAQAMPSISSLLTREPDPPAQRVTVTLPAQPAAAEPEAAPAPPSSDEATRHGTSSVEAANGGGDAAVATNPGADNGALPASAATIAPANEDVAAVPAPGFAVPLRAARSTPGPAPKSAPDAGRPPRFLPGPRSPVDATATSRRRWLLPAVIAALTVLLGLQVVLADRARLAADATWRPLVSALCGMFGCSLPAWHEPAAFNLLTRDVRPHPDEPGVLRVTATFRNDARWPQAWPEILLTLSDVDGHPVAARAFVADEYLEAPPTSSGLESGQTAALRIDVLEPATATVSYAFEFR